MNIFNTNQLEKMSTDGDAKMQLFTKLYHPFANEKQPTSISVDMDKAHSIVDEVFTWEQKD